jgi:diguanylate cyclase (GGDEF)-like protein/PAS domain S-box-containing protein
MNETERNNDLLLQELAALKKRVGELEKSAEEDSNYRTLVENAYDGIVMIGRDQKVLSCNQAFFTMFGYNKSEIEGNSIEIIHASQETAEEYGSLVYPRAKDIGAFKIDWVFIDKNGIPLFCEVGTTAIKEPDGSVERYVVTVKNITDRKHDEEKIKFLSFHDRLTGAYNRAYLEEEMRRTGRGRTLPISIIMGDVNGLKLANDAFGHSEGDKLLNAMFGILRSSCREGDLVARWGGDEFVIFLPGVSYKVAQDVMQRIKHRCSQGKKGLLILPSIALGASTKTEASQEINGIVKEAEEAMYKNKLIEGKTARRAIMESLRIALNERLGESETHLSWFKETAAQFGKAVRLEDEELAKLKLLADLSNIGYIAAPEEILKKSGPLTEEEQQMLRKHVEVGFRIAQHSPDLVHISEAILSHHERWDGEGYPNKLKGEEIPLIARMMSIVHAYDLMVYGRPYQKAIGIKDALEEISKGAGTRFDPELTGVFIAVAEKGADKTREMIESGKDAAPAK